MQAGDALARRLATVPGVDDSIKRWTTKRKTTVAKASRSFDLAPPEIEGWGEDARQGAENSPRAPPLDIREQYETQLKDRQACGEAILELRARKKLLALKRLIPPRHDARFIKVLDGDMPRWRSVRDECNRDPLAARIPHGSEPAGQKGGQMPDRANQRGHEHQAARCCRGAAERSATEPCRAAARGSWRRASEERLSPWPGTRDPEAFPASHRFRNVVAPDCPAVDDRAAGNISP